MGMLASSEDWILFKPCVGIYELTKISLMGEKGERELLAIVFTDAVGSSSQTALDEDKSLSMLMADLDSIRNEAAARGGSVLKNTGDGLLISFKSAVDAIECALSIQKAFQGRPKGQGFQHKIGVHIGDVIKKDGDIYGTGVNTTSRLVDQCAPGGVCISSTLFELTKQKTEIGKLRLKEFLLQNTDPPTLAYQSLGKDQNEAVPVFLRKFKIRKTPSFSRATVFGLLGLATVCFFVFFPLNQQDEFKKNYGFEVLPGSIKGLKSEKYGKDIEFSLENDTGVGIELRWIDFGGNPKVSDERNKELSQLGPQQKKFRGTSGAGNIFSICKVDGHDVLIYFRLLRGTQLNLVFLEEAGRYYVEPKYLKEAKQGDPVAQHRLAESFAWGNGVPANDQQAFIWAKKSADQNLPAGLGLLSVLLENGKGVARDLTLATQHRIKAADLGDPWSCYLLGKQYLEGRGIEKNSDRGVELLKRAVDKGVSPAFLALGLCYENGQGVPRDLDMAIQLYQKASDSSGNQDAQARLSEARRQKNSSAKSPSL